MVFFKALLGWVIMVALVTVIPLGLAWWLKKRCRFLKRILIGVAAVLSVLQSLFCFADITGLQADLRYLQIQAFLNQPLDRWDSVGLNAEQGIISMSYLGEGLTSYGLRRPWMKDSIAATAKTGVERAIAVAPFSDVYNSVVWGEEALYLSHLNVILGAYQRLSESKTYLALNRQISEYLRQKILDAPTHNIQSYGNYPHMWPADNSVTLYSLWLFDRNNQTDLSSKPIQSWLTYMNNEGKDRKTDLPRSELNGIEAYSAYPRGCALSWTTKYMSQFAPKDAETLWGRYTWQFKRSILPIAGFQEYPVGAPLGEDYDSGPIILGLGAAATGLALNGSKAIGDYVTYYQVADIVKVFEGLAAIAAALGDSSYWKLATDLKAIAISFQAEAFVPWW